MFNAFNDCSTVRLNNFKLKTKKPWRIWRVGVVCGCMCGLGQELAATAKFNVKYNQIRLAMDFDFHCLSAVCLFVWLSPIDLIRGFKAKHLFRNSDLIGGVDYIYIYVGNLKCIINSNASFVCIRQSRNLRGKWLCFFYIYFFVLCSFFLFNYCLDIIISETENLNYEWTESLSFSFYCMARLDMKIENGRYTNFETVVAFG